MEVIRIVADTIRVKLGDVGFVMDSFGVANQTYEGLKCSFRVMIVFFGVLKDIVR